tara:strand:- start:431 stop:847 length:417 start_codon:yes stop_codon:yes gene_type:complete
MIHSKDIPEPSEKELRSYGLMMGGVLFLFGVLFIHKGIYAVTGILCVAALTFFFMGLVDPSSLIGTHRRWMNFAMVLGSFNLKVIIGFIYLTGFTFIRMVFLITRKDPMHRKFDTNTKTYWVEHQESENDPQRYEKLY